MSLAVISIGYYWYLMETMPLPLVVQWMKKRWGQVTGWGQCFAFPSVLWHCWLDDEENTQCVKARHLSAEVLFQYSWRKKTEEGRTKPGSSGKRWKMDVGKWQLVIVLICFMYICSLCLLDWTTRYGGPGVELSAEHDHTAAVFHIFMFNQVLK